MNSATIGIFTLSGVMSLAVAATAGTYTTIDVAGAVATEPSGINSSGDIVGTYTDHTGASHGFQLLHGAFVSIDYPGATGTFAISVDPQGDVAGFFLDSSNHWHGFVRIDGAYVIQDYPGATTGSFTLGVSANGILVGEFKVGQLFGQLGFAWILRDTDYVQLTPPGSTQAFATSVNSSGNVVGRLIDTTGRQLAWKLDKKGNYTIFQFPGASLTNARSINDRGEVVGVYFLNGVNHGFVLPKENVVDFTTIDFPGAATTRALGISPAGQIVGTYDRAGVRHGFLLTRDERPSQTATEPLPSPAGSKKP